VNKVVTLTAWIILLLILSASGSISETKRLADSEAHTSGRVNDRPPLPNIFSCRLSGTFRSENGSCLVFRFDLRNIRLPGDDSSLVLDFYMYDTLLSKERTITRRLNVNL